MRPTAVAAGHNGTQTISVNQTVSWGVTTDQSTYPSGTYTPAASGRLVLIGMEHSQTAASVGDATSITGTSISGAVKIASVGISTNSAPTLKAELWAALSTGSAGVVTINLPGTPTGCQASLSEIVNADTAFGTLGVAQSVTNFDDASTTAVFATLTKAFVGVKNATFFVCGANATSATTPKSGWTELRTANIITPNQRYESQFIATNDAAAQMTLTGGTAWGAIAAEIQAL